MADKPRQLAIVITFQDDDDPIIYRGFWTVSSAREKAKRYAAYEFEGRPLVDVVSLVSDVRCPEFASERDVIARYLSPEAARTEELPPLASQVCYVNRIRPVQKTPNHSVWVDTPNAVAVLRIK